MQASKCVPLFPQPRSSPKMNHKVQLGQQAEIEEVLTSRRVTNPAGGNVVATEILTFSLDGLNWNAPQLIALNRRTAAGIPLFFSFAAVLFWFPPFILLVVGWREKKNTCHLLSVQITNSFFKMS